VAKDTEELDSAVFIARRIKAGFYCHVNVSPHSDQSLKSAYVLHPRRRRDDVSLTQHDALCNMACGDQPSTSTTILDGKCNPDFRNLPGTDLLSGGHLLAMRSLSLAASSERVESDLAVVTSKAPLKEEQWKPSKLCGHTSFRPKPTHHHNAEFRKSQSKFDQVSHETGSPKVQKGML
jgi:hypothetical protein